MDFLEIAGEMRKVITFAEGNTFLEFQWIEGIGNITGFDLIWEALDITGGSLLVCFTNDVDTYYFNGANSCDNTTLGIDDLTKDNINRIANSIRGIF